MTYEQEFPLRWDITIYQGMVWEHVFAIHFKDALGADQLLDTAGWTAEMTIKESPTDTDVIGTYTTATGRIMTGITVDPYGDFNLWVRLSATDTGALPASFVGEYNLTLTPPSGAADEVRFSHGTCCVDPEVKA